MLSVGSVVGGAFRLIREHPLAVAVWGLAYLAAAVLGTLAISSSLDMQAAADAGDVDAVMAAFGSGLGLIVLMQLFVYVLMVVMFTAAMRAVLRPFEGGPAFIRFGMDEVRIIALTIIFVVAFYAALIAIILIVGILFGTMFRASSAGGGAGVILVAIALGVAALVLGVWLYVRLSLAYPLTLLRRKIIIGESWTLTRGHALPLFGAYLVIFLVVITLSGLVAAVTSGPYFDELMNVFDDPDRAMRAADNQLRRMSEINAMTVAGWLINGMSGGITTALLAGSAATAARALAGDQLLAREFA